MSEPAPDFPFVVAVGASAGGVEALSKLIRDLPGDFAAPVLVVLHVAPAGTSVLAKILARAGDLDASTAVDGEPLRAGHVFVAPPDRHLVVEAGRVRLTREPRENGHRPALDPTFRSLAAVYGRAAVGVVLSGTRDDGSRGLAAIKAAGGRALVQDPEDCLYDGMPRNAISATTVDAVLRVRELAGALAEMTGPDAPPVPGSLIQISEPRGTRFTCPDCGGVLSDVRENGTDVYTCSVGHAYSPESLEEGQARLLESALWAAVRTLEDRGLLLQRLAVRAAQRGEAPDALETEAADALERADQIRAIVLSPAQPRPNAA